MPILPKPSSKPAWTQSNPSVRQEPTGGKKNSGWAPNERPPAEFQNWLEFIESEWIDYLESATDSLLSLAPDTTQIYRAIIGSGGIATHATLAAALTDPAVVPGSKIFVMANHAETINTLLQCAKNDIEIDCAPGVVFTAGSATQFFRVTAVRFTFKGGRFLNFAKAFSFDAGSVYGRMLNNNFNTCAIEIEDLTPGTSTIIQGSITE